MWINEWQQHQDDAPAGGGWEQVEVSVHCEKSRTSTSNF